MKKFFTFFRIAIMLLGLVVFTLPAIDMSPQNEYGGGPVAAVVRQPGIERISGARIRKSEKKLLAPSVLVSSILPNTVTS